MRSACIFTKINTKKVGDSKSIRSNQHTVFGRINRLTLILNIYDWKPISVGLYRNNRICLSFL